MDEPTDGLAGACGVERLWRAMMDKREELEELRVVVQHLFEMRHQPALVDRVAGKSAAEVIVDAALADSVEGGFDQGEIAWLAGAQACPPQELEQGGIGEFWGTLHAAVDRVDGSAGAAGNGVEFGQAEDHAAGRPGGVVEALHERGAVLLDLARLFAKQAGELTQDVDESRAPVTGGFGKIGATPHGLAVGGEKHGQRPAALLAQKVKGRHVDLVDVGALFAIDFDVDEQVVHHRGGGVVFETLVGHDVAPMAGGIADRQQDWLAGTLGFAEGVGAPRAPVDGIVLVLKEVGARFVRQAIFTRTGGSGGGHGGPQRFEG